MKKTQNNVPSVRDADCSVRAGAMNLRQVAELQKQYAERQATKTASAAAQVVSATTIAKH